MDPTPTTKELATPSHEKEENPCRNEEAIKEHKCHCRSFYAENGLKKRE